MKTPYSIIKLVVLLLALTIAAGCSKKEEAKPASQVAARVNAEEITVSQINNILSRAQNLPPEAAAKAKSEILDKLIDQQLAKQQAIATKLDRTPAVVQAIEAAKDEILARSYLEKVASSLPKPTPDEIKKYYFDHPELFSARRIYSLEELIVEPRDGLSELLKTQVANAKSLQQIATWLQAEGVKFSANRGVRAAEALPLELLPQLQALKDGDFHVVDTGDRLNVFHVVTSQNAPVDEAAATPRIQQFLSNQKVTKAIAVEVKAMRDKAEIAYLGEFSGGAAAAEAKAKAEAEAQAKAAAEAKAQEDRKAQAEALEKTETKSKAEAEAQARAEAMAKSRSEAEAARQKDGTNKDTANSKPLLKQEHIEKGLSGLK